jgi:hypothetical protein
MTLLLEGQIPKDWLHLEKVLTIKPNKINGLFSIVGVVMLMVDVLDGYVIVRMPPKRNIPTWNVSSANEW